MNTMARFATIIIITSLITFTGTGCGGGSGNGGKQAKGDQSQQEDHQHEGHDHQAKGTGKEYDHGDHDEAGMAKSEQGNTSVPSFQNVNEATKQVMGKVKENYFALKEAFVATDAKKASQEDKNLLALFDNEALGSLEGKQESFYKKKYQEIEQALTTIEKSSDIKKQRKAFESVSNNMYKLLKAFGTEEGKVYRQYCPMAFDNEGAYWLSDAQKIRNPYFGDKMLKCGKVRETF